MRFLSVIFCLYLAASLCEGAVVQKRIYRNTEEILVPVTVIQDGDQIKDPVKSVETEAIAEQIANVVDEGQKLEASEVVAEAQRRFDEAIVEEEIKEVVAEENKELLNAVAEEETIEKEIIKHDLLEEKKEEELKTLSAITQEAVVQPEAIKAVEVLPVNQQEAEKPLQQIKSVLVEKETPEKIVVVVETAEEDEPEGAGRQATQATPAQTTQQNFVQQFIQNSPLGQFFNQITGQNTPAPVANDEGAPATPAPTNPGFLNPVAAFTNAAQSAVNSTQQALQQFASNIGNQFQNTLSSLTGQPQQQQQLGTNDATTARPGPILQLVNTFMGNNPQSAQPAPGQQQGPLQGLLNIFQGNNRPQSPAAAPTTTIKPQPGKQPEITEQTNDAAEEVATDEINNEIRSSGEVADSFEDNVQPEELIVVNDDASQTHDAINDEQESANVSK